MTEAGAATTAFPTSLPTVRLGRTGLQVSVAGLGCGGHSRLGLGLGRDVAHAADLVRRAVDLGVTFIDTARAYGTEEAVGLGLQGQRDKVALCTKALPWRGTRPTPADVTAQLEESLRTLRTDYVDVYLIHGVLPDDYPYVAETLLPELERQKAAGKLRFIGASELFGDDTTHRMLARAVPDGVLDVVMVGFNLINAGARRTVFPATTAQDVGTLIMFAVRQALSRPEMLRALVQDLIAEGKIDPASVDPADPLGFLADLPGAPSVTEAAYRFCRHEPGAHVILTGTGDPAHLEANIAAITAPPLPAEALARLGAIFGAVDSIGDLQRPRPLPKTAR